MVTGAYNKDPSHVKLNFGVGAYRTEEGKPLVLNVVRKAAQKLVNDPSRVKEYLSIPGLVDFDKLSAKLILGADSKYKEDAYYTEMPCLALVARLWMSFIRLLYIYLKYLATIQNPTQLINILTNVNKL
ncbi:hypothetical protein BVRB_6g144690 [Beta vulgaris subsp. vulgaris]|nr:hypothetical protein BVRB_6g144690 [Beta vulgaris subsp. vulgaris]